MSTNYTILSSYTDSTLEQQVLEHLCSGWELVGGVSITSVINQIYIDGSGAVESALLFSQAMRKPV